MILTTISGGRLSLDGGTMFGVVPKVLWEKKCPPDDRNRVAMDTNCLLVRSGGRTLLVDTGYGTKASADEVDNFAFAGPALLENLAAAGVSPDDVDAVVLTHLHFDHAGGCTRLDAGGRPVPTFPKARHFIQRREWDDATGDIPELRGSYFTADFLPLDEAGLVELVDGEAEVMPGVFVHLAPGHTRGHQIVELRHEDRRAVYLGDLCPLVPHLRTFWTMAYDQFPLEVRRNKPRVLEEIVGEGRLALFDHDLQTKGAYLSRDARGNIVVDRPAECDAAGNVKWEK